MSIEKLTQPAPIFKLDSDVLHRIFLTNTYRARREFSNLRHFSPDCSLSPLTITQQTSQVCHAWRDILLHSPSIWARCIDLDALSQKTGRWRHLVLPRTGKAMLCITATMGGGTLRTPGAPRFLLKLLKNHWGRIQEIDLPTSTLDLHDPEIMDKFASPAENLKMLVLYSDIDDWSSETQRVKLLGGIAPSLVHLSLPPDLYTFDIHLPSPSMFTNNMRHLDVRVEALDAMDLLETCLSMPFLETLGLEIPDFTVKNASEMNSLPCPEMSRLHLIRIDCPALLIYPAFLNRLTPSNACALYMQHSLDISSELEERLLCSLAQMQLVFSAYTDSFSTHSIDNLAFNDALLSISRRHFTFSCYGKTIGMSIRKARPDDVWSWNLPPSIIARLLGIVAAINLPHSSKQLDFSVDLHEPLLSPSGIVSAALFRALNSMTWVTTLRLRIADRNTHLKLSGLGFVLPSLKTLILRSEPDRRYKDLVEVISTFISARHVNAPLETIILESTYAARIHAAELCYALDEIPGLAIAWKEKEQ